ncbi:MAG: hypothetical protein QOD06_2764 [Candidatus Binatota bacterium]|nr:hypothetical protein [Candidatus Binatota bacterium]
MPRWISLVIAIALAAIVPAPAGAQTIIKTCGKVYGSVRLGANLSTTAESCLDVQQSGITIDGANYRITAGTFAILVTEQSKVTIKNVVSSQGVQVYGPNANDNVIQNSKLGPVAVYQGDRIKILKNTMQSLLLAGLYNDPVQDALVQDNLLQWTTIPSSKEKLFRLSTGSDATHLCAEGRHRVINNTLVGAISASVAASDPEAEARLLWISCGRKLEIRGNTVQSPSGRAIGLLMRDEADDNYIADNIFDLKESQAGNLLIQSGSEGYFHPRRNVFYNNRFKVGSGRAMNYQANNAWGNQFQRNVFWTVGGTTESVRIADGLYFDAVPAANQGAYTVCSGNVCWLPEANNVFDHNTFYHGGTGALIVFRELGASMDPYYDPRRESTRSIPPRQHLTNNIFSTSGSELYGFDTLINVFGYDGDYNLFQSRSSVAAPSSLQALGLDVHSFVANPRFVSSATGNFNLCSGSAAIGKGASGSDVGAFPYSPLTRCK